MGCCAGALGKKCPAGHDMKFDKASYDSYRCDKCGSNATGERYNCPSCHYDLCTKCEPAPLVRMPGH